MFGTKKNELIVTEIRTNFSNSLKDPKLSVHFSLTNTLIKNNNKKKLLSNRSRAYDPSRQPLTGSTCTGSASLFRPKILYTKARLHLNRRASGGTPRTPVIKQKGERNVLHSDCRQNILPDRDKGAKNHSC